MPSINAASPRISVVIATYNRLALLERCIEHTRAALAYSADGEGESEIIVIDGGSTDGAAEWLADQTDLRVHVEADRAGCCAAYNLGFRMARGHYVMWLNDDSFPLPGAIDAAIDLMERGDMLDVGMVAFYHNHREPWNELHGIDVPWRDAPNGDSELAIAAGVSAADRARRSALAFDPAPARAESDSAARSVRNADAARGAPAGRSAAMDEVSPGAEAGAARPLRFGVLHVRGRPYANFGLLRNNLLRQLNWLDPEYKFCAWDPDLSLKVQVQAGLRVLGTPLARVFHGEHIDERKQNDLDTARTRDNEHLFAKWKLPPKGEFADAKAEYRELLRARGLVL